MSQSPAAKAKADKFPAELKPNPSYEYELPEVFEDGTVAIDAGALEWAQRLAEQGAKRGWPRGRG